LEVQVSHEGSVAVIAPGVKRLDAAVAPDFKKQVVALVEGGQKRIVIDMTRVEFVDSSGLGALVSILKALGGQGALAVGGASGRVLSLFQLTRMDKVFAIEATREAAVQRLAGG
jgi:anti-sigma B factor antagonist